MRVENFRLWIAGRRVPLSSRRGGDLAAAATCPSVRRLCETTFAVAPYRNRPVRHAPDWTPRQLTSDHASCIGRGEL